eukprot:CAMPEP_0198143254 /NCGR_PEP_ID=MMETSP1443-20131203/6200_1 /TAXON_ID=186043 /ORGANISM="Entomoneis sp., Strain CCMP2396" /LENGTH=175 /DNA_ID=CAMNT_0043806469 /DNA_START=205 /DNA_END=732 /DNA_ORIENTATION=+
MPVNVATFSSGNNKRTSKVPLSTISKCRSPTALSPPPRLRRTKSLPSLFEDNDTPGDNNNSSSANKSLFWFRPHPEKPLIASRAVTPASKFRAMIRSHRRRNTSPDPLIPKELSLPTLQEEQPAMLKPGYILQDLTFTDASSSSAFDSSLYSDGEEDDEFDLNLVGLSILEGRDE